MTSTAAGAYAISGYAYATNNTSAEVGVWGTSDGAAAGSSGMFGFDGSSSSGAYTIGVTGKSLNGRGGIGVLGYGSSFSKIASAELGGLPAGVWGDGTSEGVVGTSDGGYGVLGRSTDGYGVTGYSSNSYAVVGQSGESIGVLAYNAPSSPDSSNPTLYATGGSASSQYVLYTSNSIGTTYVRTDSGAGNLVATGGIYGAAKYFRIDHPLDPAGKYLLHADIESPDMKNLYDGVVQLDSRGEGTVQLPDYFEALNQDFRYQLTSIGAPGPNLYVAQEISGNQFRIAGGQPGAKVSWQVTGIRHDAWANANRLQAEVPKTGKEAGHYLHPRSFGQPDSMSTDYHEPIKMRALRHGQEEAGSGSGRTQPKSAMPTDPALYGAPKEQGILGAHQPRGERTQSLQGVTAITNK